MIPALSEVKEALCADKHPGLIRMYQALQEGWEPPRSVSEEEYNNARVIPQYESTPFTAFASFACSFGGKEWGGYARGKKASGEPRNYADEGARRLLSKFPTEAECLFLCSSFVDLPDTPPAVYYCDPPYRNTTKYKTGDFDHRLFDQWCENLARNGCAVFVSEFAAPEHWETVWEIDRSATCTIKSKKVTDKLFRVVPL